MEDFQYVVERVKPAKVCFGSAVPRSTDPVGKAGSSSFQRRYIGENFVKVHPQTYDLSQHTSIKQLLNKVRSNKGVGGLVSIVPRFPYKHTVHTHMKYDLEAKWGNVKESRVPFGSKKPRETMPIKSKTPGPGNYKIVDRKCFRTKFDYNFGNPKMVHATPTYCISKIVDTCDRCDLICQGDYWHKNFANFFCQQCYEEENYFHKKYTIKEMKEFKKIRNCSFMHQHDGTTAALRIKPWNKIFKQICVENYLDLFLKC